MNIFRMIHMAAKNTFRSKLRTSLTVIAIVIGAFTLMLTNGIGTGINRYIDTQLDAIGGDDVMNVVVADSDAEGAESNDIAEYNPDKQTQSIGGSPQFEVLNDEDISTIEGIDGVESVRPVYFLQADYISAGDKKYEVMINVSLPGGELDYAAGNGVTDEDTNQIVLSEDYVEILGFDNAEDAVGETIEIGASSAAGEIKTVEAEVVGVQKPTLIDLGMNTSESVRSEVYDINRDGLPEGTEKSYIQAQAIYDPSLGEEHVQNLKDDLESSGYQGQTVTDQIGMFKSIIDIVVGVLNGFALIALIAAGFGIINTLLMSVQERTREIGLMKAMGMGSGKVFTLFTLEALFIGVLGSIVGIGAGAGVGAIVNNVARNNLEALGGIDIIVFAVPDVLTIIGIILFIAFIAGTLPASRAARQNPIDALRYE